MLPDVYNPQERPWMKPENASVAELKAQINECPSGALSYEDDSVQKEESMAIKATIKPNGPMLIKGDMELTGVDGVVENRSGMTAICRCGASANKPYCDGSHAKVGFEG